MPISAVLFDLDNTLIDFLKLKRMCVENAVDAMIDSGLDIPKEDAIKILFEIYMDLGMEYQHIFQDFSNKVLGREDYKIMAAGINAYRRTKISYLEPYPHVTSTLTQLARRGIKLGIVTDAEKMQAWIRISALKLGHLLDVVVTFSDTGKRKPNPAPFKRALKELSVQPEECLFVGDWVERDIAGAKSAGMRTCFAKYGSVSKGKSHADYEIDDVKEILDLIC
jgi:HAD superfamily hydrolase (TIGR02253 family)